MIAALPLETVELVDAPARSRAFLAPSRGGMVTRFFVGDRPLLYLDDATLADPTKNVRGGVPILFPSPGKLTLDAFEREGARGRMGQHGFARAVPWEIVSRGPADVTLRLVSTVDTRAQYPFDFKATYRTQLRGATLSIEQAFINTGSTPMPFACGFHPYFLVRQAAKGASRIGTNATAAWDNAGKRRVALDGPIDLTLPEIDLHLDDHGRNQAELLLDDGATIVVKASPEFRRWVVWTVAGKDFVCLEPWTAPADALNTGAGLLVLAPGASLALSTEIVFVAGEPTARA